MKLELKIYDHLCATKVFNINGVNAYSDDFGRQMDMGSCLDNPEDFGCGEMQFIKKDSTPAILKHYNITEEEYSEICEKLEDMLSFGNCSECV
jgi:hypothetical protein